MNHTQMLKGILDWCVLSIIQKEKIYSQEIVTKLRAQGFPEMSDGTLFPLMLRLEKDGLAESEKKENPLGPSRKYYGLSEKGRQALKEFIPEWRSFKTKIDRILEEGAYE